MKRGYALMRLISMGGLCLLSAGSVEVQAQQPDGRLDTLANELAIMRRIMAEQEKRLSVLEQASPPSKPGRFRLTRSSAGGSVPVPVGFPLGCCARFRFFGVPRRAGLAGPGRARFQLPIGCIEITEDEAKVVTDDTIRKLDPQNFSYATLHSLAFVLRPYLRVGWASQTHTASPLFAFGSGPGSEELVGFRHNTELFRIMKTSLEAGR